MDLEITKVPIIQITKGSSVIEVPSSNNEIGIASGTLRLKRSIVDTDIAFGEPIASEFSVELFNIEEDLQGCPIQVFLEDRSGTSYTRTAIFTGVIDSSKTDNIGHTRQIVAYDWIYYHRNDNMADWWNNYWEPATGYSVKGVRDDFLEYLGFTAPTREYVNDYNTHISWSNADLPIVTTITFAQIIRMFCEIQGTFPYIDGSGNLDFAVLDNSVTTDLRGEYESYNSNWEDFVTDTITGIAVYSSSEDLLTMVGTDDNVYNIAGNIWLMHLEEYYHENVVETLTRLLGVISNIQYKPCQLKMIKAHNGLVLGQRVQTDKGYAYVMSEELYGVCFVEQTIEAKASASKLSGEVNDINDTMVQGNKISKVEKTIDSLQVIIGDSSSGLVSEVNQLKDKIVLKVDANGRIVQVALSANASTGSEFKVSADNIDFIANGVMNLTANAIGINASNFKLDKDTGNIICTGGTIGNWNINDTSIYKLVHRSYSNYSTDYNSFIKPSSIDYIYQYRDSDEFYINRSSLDSGGLKIYRNLAGTNDQVIIGHLGGGAGIENYSDPNIHYVSSVLSFQSYNLDSQTPVEGPLFDIDASGFTFTDENHPLNNCWLGQGHFYSARFTNDSVLYNDIYDGVSTCATSKTQIEYLSTTTLTSHKVLVSDSNSKVAESFVTATELGYVSGTTSNIQEQIDDVNEDIDATPVTVSGNPITITDATNIPCEELEVTIEPQQDLHGYDKPWVGGEGKNLYDCTISEQSPVVQHITFTNTQDSDGNIIGVHVEGTATGYAPYEISFTLPAGTYKTFRDRTSNKVDFNVRNSSGGWFADPETDFTLSGQTTLMIRYYVQNGVSVNDNINVMVYIYSGQDATSFAPYENICPISGLTRFIVDRFRNNLFNQNAPRNSTFTSDYATIIANYFTNNGYYAAGYPTGNVGNIVNNHSYETAVILVKSGLTYNIKAFNGSNFSKAIFLDANYNIVSASNGWVTSWSHTALSNEKYLLVGTANNNPNLQISIGSEPTYVSYSNYKRITLQAGGQIVYEGTVNYLTGRVTVTRKSVDLSTLTWTMGSRNRWLSDAIADIKQIANNVVIDAYTDRYALYSAETIYVSQSLNGLAENDTKQIVIRNGSTTNTPIGQLVYELATRMTIQLSPQELELLDGNNYIVTNGVRIDLKYQKDNVVGDIKKWTLEELTKKADSLSFNEATRVLSLKSGNTVLSSVTIPTVAIVPFATATDKQIQDMLTAYYEGEITWEQMGWQVGDTRVIHLDAMQAPNPNSENTWSAQDITVVIVAHDHTELETPINGHTKACITVHTREVMNNNSESDGQVGHVYINGDNSLDRTFNSWKNIYIRSYMNNTLFNAFQNSIKNMIKPSLHYRHTTYNQNTSEQVVDKLFLPSYAEIYGDASYQYYTPTSPAEGTQFEYYKTDANRIKYGNNNGVSNNVAQKWWEGSCSSYNPQVYGYMWCSVEVNGSKSVNGGDIANGLAPAFAM